jgi:hypothetical protein
VCQDEAQHDHSKVTISASNKAADFLFKAVRHVVTGGEYPEDVNDLKLQNPASKKLCEEIDGAFDLMAANLVKEVEKILDPTNAEI